MLSCLVLTQEWHLEKQYHFFAYLEKCHNYELVIDPSDQVIYQYESEFQDWTSSKFFHVSGMEDIPTNMPATIGLVFVVAEMVDADHAGYTFTRRSIGKGL